MAQAEAHHEADDARPRLSVHDPVWERIRVEAAETATREPMLAGFLHATVLGQTSLEDAISQRIADRVGDPVVPSVHIRQAFRHALAADPALSEIFRVDIVAVYDRDPACNRLIEPLLYFKGFHAIATHRLAHWLWTMGRKDFALMLQSRSSSVFQTDIHPAVAMGRGIFLDHATGLVIGGTARLGDNVSMLQGVTLGGTGKESGDRHPKIGSGVLIGAGAKILGNIAVGDCSRIASGSVVLKEVPANVTVAGVPAKIVGEAGCPEPARSMDQILADFREPA